MGTPIQEEGMRLLARAIDSSVDGIYDQNMGFFLVVGPMENNLDAIADYIGNCERETAIEWMEETVKRLKAQSDIPASQGNA